jgi:hypothetical protein
MAGDHGLSSQILRVWPDTQAPRAGHRREGDATPTVSPSLHQGGPGALALYGRPGAHAPLHKGMGSRVHGPKTVDLGDEGWAGGRRLGGTATLPHPSVRLSIGPACFERGGLAVNHFG